MDFLTDTTFLIDIWRGRSKPSDALRFIENHENAVAGLPWVVKGEFLRGASLAGHSESAVSMFLETFIVAWPTEETLRRYASVYTQLKKQNTMIGPNDLWIAACALERELPLLTRNSSEFSRVNDLQILDYRHT
jgi:tRNA(fMet)-specific endonuclease VapC